MIIIFVKLNKKIIVLYIESKIERRTNMKKIILVFLISLMILNITGCNKEPEVEPNPVNQIEYDILDNSDLPEKLANIVDTMKKEKGYINLREEDYNFIVVSSGEKMTGGYLIEVNSVEHLEKSARIIVTETSPEEGSIVTEAITYPHIILRLPMAIEEVIVVNEDGEEFKELFLEDIKITTLGTYVGQIDNNFIEVRISDKPNVFMINDASREKIEELKDNSQVEMTYYYNENGQFVLTDIKTIEANNQSSSLEGTYVGQIDPTSIEVIVNGKPYSFVSYDMERVLQGINEGDKIRVEYTDENGRFFIENIEKIN